MESSTTILPPANGVSAPAKFKAAPKAKKRNRRVVVLAAKTTPSEPPPPVAASPVKKRGGRKPGSKNKPKSQASPVLALAQAIVGPRVPRAAVVLVEQVLHMGANKYEGREWTKRPNDHIAKAMGHLSSAMAGGKYDPDTGLSPIAHAAARLILALQIEIEKK